MSWLTDLLGNTATVGKEGLGSLVGALDILASAGHGNLGANLINRSQALDNPAVRANIGPFLAGFLGTYGGRQPTGELRQAGLSQPLPGGVQVLGPGEPQGTPQTAFQANLPPLSQEAQVKQLLERAQLGNALGTGALFEPRRQLLQAQLESTVEKDRYLQAFNQALAQLNGGGAPSGELTPVGGSAPRPGARTLGSTGLSLNTLGFTPQGGTLSYGQPPEPIVKTVPLGTPSPTTGKPLTGPENLGRRTTLLPTPQPTQLGQAQQTQTLLDLVERAKGMLSDPAYAEAKQRLGPAFGSIIRWNPMGMQYQAAGGGPLVPGLPGPLGHPLSQQQIELANIIGMINGVGITGLAGTGTGRLKSVVDEFKIHLPNLTGSATKGADTAAQLTEKLNALSSRYRDVLARIPANAAVPGNQVDVNQAFAGYGSAGLGSASSGTSATLDAPTNLDEINTQRKALGLPPMQ